MPKSFLNNMSLPRGLRNNNPGNLVITNIAWEGKVPNSQNTDGKFEQFYELRYGIRAMMRDIVNDLKGGTTITQFISKYAPSFENNTAAYINSVATALGINANVKIEPTEDIVLALAKIITRVENGSQHTLVTDADYNEALSIIGIPLKKKAVTTQS